MPYQANNEVKNYARILTVASCKHRIYLNKARASLIPLPVIKVIQNHGNLMDEMVKRFVSHLRRSIHELRQKINMCLYSEVCNSLNFSFDKVMI